MGVITPAIVILFCSFVDFLLLSSVKKRHCIALLWQATLKSAACWSRRMQTLARGTGAAASAAQAMFRTLTAFVSLLAETAKVHMTWPSTRTRPMLPHIFGVSAVRNDALFPPRTGPSCLACLLRPTLKCSKGLQLSGVKRHCEHPSPNLIKFF